MEIVRFLCATLLGQMLVAADCPSIISDPVAVGVVESTDITEASGLAASWRNPGVFWTHNDGARGKIFALNTEGQLLAIFKISKSLEDVEDIAVGPGPETGTSYLYVGDIGSNNANRSEVRILRIAEPAAGPEAIEGTLDFDAVEVFRLKYPSGEYDAEALLVDPVSRELFIATKEKGGSHVFGINLDGLVDGKTATLDSAAHLDFAQISGGAISRDGSLIALRREEAAIFWRRDNGESVSDALNRPPLPLRVVGPPTEPNGEGLAFLPDASGYLTISEGEHPTLYRFEFGDAQAAAFASLPRIANGRVQFEVAGCAGRQIDIQRSSDLIHWETVQTITAAETPQSFAEQGWAELRFYRLVAK